jgi:hypothetical protein
MSDAKYGTEFIKHEFDEAIAVQQAIVDGARRLSTSHPDADSKRAVKSGLAADERFLKKLQELGQPYGASGELDKVARSLKELMDETAGSAGEAESEAYELTRSSSTSSGSNRILRRRWSGSLAR